MLRNSYGFHEATHRREHRSLVKSEPRLDSGDQHRWVISALRMLRQEELEFEASLGPQ